MKAHDRKVLFSSKTGDWTTPQPFLRKLEQMFGKFDLDPASAAHNAVCSRYYTIEDNGLVQDWTGNPFCNPPYIRGILQKWIQKAYEESQKHGNQIVLLIPSRTDTKYWHNYVMKAAEVHLIEGRLKFGGAVNSAPFPSAVVVFRPGHQGPPEFFSLKAK